jgi:hypothetical protein
MRTELFDIRTELAGSLQITDKQLLTSYLLLHLKKISAQSVLGFRLHYVY